ncbi:immunity 52 family protein [Myxococcus stipitatus]|uniref:Imm52 family immunity protein n=1 Tax=Myxococcus stipitatus TaxID=83455 RepID=UPI001F2370EA|nr:Imm52 family immunity protein [Myxococcus stipitatus]MCE9672099.1 immunity 52 family protein [Myxococcus stipitatus]
MSPRARRYQERISGLSADEASWGGGVGKDSGGVKFDGFEEGVLLEAKGPGYATFFKGLDPKRWFKNSGAKSLGEQALRQVNAAKGMPIRWPKWFRQSKSRKDAWKEPVAPNHAELAKALGRTKDRHHEDLGYRISGWNGALEESDACSFDAAVGIYSEWVKNFWLFELPIRGASSERVVTARVLSGLLRCMATALEPDWGVAMSHAHRDVADPNGRATAQVGWVTYLSHRLGVEPPLPAPVRIEKVEEKGTLIVLTPERFTASNPDHVALAERVRELLDQVGLLKPLQVQP